MANPRGGTQLSASLNSRVSPSSELRAGLIQESQARQDWPEHVMLLADAESPSL